MVLASSVAPFTHVPFDPADHVDPHPKRCERGVQLEVTCEAAQLAGAAQHRASLGFSHGTVRDEVLKDLAHAAVGQRLESIARAQARSKRCGRDGHRCGLFCHRHRFDSCFLSSWGSRSRSTHSGVDL